MTSPGIWLAYDFFETHTWLADWIAGVGQAVGALGTLAAVWFALRVERKAEKRRHTEDVERENARVRLVSVQLLPVGPNPPQSVRTVRVRNDSQYAIFNVQPYMRVPGVDRPVWRVAKPGGVHRSDVIESRGVEEFVVSYFDSSGARALWPADTTADIVFDDFEGFAWSRASNGEVAKVIQSAEEFASLKPSKKYRRKQRWWSPYRDKPALSWHVRTSLEFKRRRMALATWCSAWLDRLRGLDMSDRWPPD